MIQAPDKNKQLIFNTDFEYQYTSNDLKELCNKFKITQSFSKKGCPYYNACIESFHSSIKKEEIYRNTYQTFEEANIAILKVGITEEGCTLLLIYDSKVMCIINKKYSIKKFDLLYPKY